MTRDISSFAIAKISKALDDVIVAIYTAARGADAEVVHKLRVSIRRFNQAVRVFRQYVPADPAARISKRLRQVIKAAGEVRDRDILIGLLEGTSVATTPFEDERALARQALMDLARTIQNSGAPRRWRARLLGGQTRAMGR